MRGTRDCTSLITSATLGLKAKRKKNRRAYPRAVHEVHPRAVHEFLSRTLLDDHVYARNEIGKFRISTNIREPGMATHVQAQ